MLERIRNYKAAILALMVGVLPLIVRYRIVKLIGGDSVSYGSTHVLYLLNYFDAYKTFVLITAGAMLLILLIAENFYDRKKLEVSPFLWIPLIVYLAVLFLSAALSEFPYNALWGFTNRMEGFLALFSYVILFIAAYSYASDKESFKKAFPQFEGFLIFGAAVLFIIGMLQLWGADPFTWKIFYKTLVPDDMRGLIPFVESKFVKRAYVTLSNPNYVGSYCSLVLAFFIVRFLASDDKKKQKLLYGASVFMLTALLAGSRSRAGMVGVAVAIGLIFLLDAQNLKSRWKEWTKLAAIMMSAVFFLEITTGGFVSNWILSMGGRFEWLKNVFPILFTENAMQNEDVLRMGSGRLLIWKLTLPMLKDTVFIGNGPDTFIFHYPQAEYFDLGGKAFVSKPHNMYLQMFVNVGGLALAAFLGLAFAILGKTLRKLRRNPLGNACAPFAASVVAYMATGFFNDSVVSSAPIFWIFLGILAGMGFTRKVNSI